MTKGEQLMSASGMEPSSSDNRRRRFAFFDVDETVIRFKTMFVFQHYYYRHTGFLPAVTGPIRHRVFLRSMRGYERAGRSREFMNAAYYHFFSGRPKSIVCRLARQWFQELRDTSAEIFFPTVIKVLRQHQMENTSVVLVSGSFTDVLEPIAEELGAYKILATQLETKHGIYTGRLKSPQMIGAGKAAAVRALLMSEGSDRAHAWAYGDHHSDISMLEEVDHPNVVSRDPSMMALAKQRGWRLLDPLGT